MMAAVRIVDIVSDNDDKRYESAGRMAAAIIEITREQGRCLRQDLNQRGFAPDEVVKLWHLANSLAAVEFQQISVARSAISASVAHAR